MKIKLLINLSLITLFGCSIKYNQNFNYQKLVTPEQIASDIKDLKTNLEKKHYDINWEGKKSSIFDSLNNILKVSVPISIDSFETRLSSIINKIDDGHSRVLHQDSIKRLKGIQFGYLSISGTIGYLRIGNFLNTDSLNRTLEKFLSSYTKEPKDIIILDIRSNPGGNINNVSRTLSYFLPSKTKIFEKIETKPTSAITRLTYKLTSPINNLKIRKYSTIKNINGSPKIVLWINDSIASGSMLLSYHLQNNGATVIGMAPKGVFNTFGNSYTYKLKQSKIIYTLANARVFITKAKVVRMDDMLIPDFIPESSWKLPDLVKHISNKEKCTTANN